MLGNMMSTNVYKRITLCFLVFNITVSVSPVVGALCGVRRSISHLRRTRPRQSVDHRNAPVVFETLNRDYYACSRRLCADFIISFYRKTHEMEVNCDADKMALSRRDAGSRISTVAATSLIAPFLAADTSEAISPEVASSSYDGYASTYNDLDGGSVASALGIDDARSKVISMARGDVLEIGVGTGLNLGRYNFGEGGVTSLTLVDISEGMLLQARARTAMLGIPDKGVKVSFIRADATSDLVSLFGRNVFDTVVDSFSLCVMGNEGAKNCLKQLRDAVKDEKNGGLVLLIENTRSSNTILGMYQDMTAVAAADIGGKGCVYNQDVSSMIKQTSGLVLLKNDSIATGLFQSFVCSKT